MSATDNCAGINDKSSHLRFGSPSKNCSVGKETWTAPANLKNCTNDDRMISASKHLLWFEREAYPRPGCPARDAICALSKKRGHFASVCKSRPHELVGAIVDDSDELPACLGALHDTSSSWTKKTFIAGTTAILAFGFEGHITAAVSRGRRPVDRTAGAALSLIDLTHVRVYSRATHDDFFSAFFDPKGRRMAFACFPFFFDHFN